MNNDRPETGTPRRRVRYRDRKFSSACLSCTDLVNCCGRTEFDGASPAKAKKPGPSRRDLLKAMGAVSAILALEPLVGAAGSYFIPKVPTTFQPTLIAKKSDVPVNGSTVFWFPFTTDPTYTNMLIHLPPDLARQAGNEFVAYNRTCIHLQCLTSYLSSSEIIGCPCHGSIYRPTDGWPIGGPAEQIARYLPYVQLKFEGENIYAVNVNLNDIGYGNTAPPPKGN